MQGMTGTKFIAYLLAGGGVVGYLAGFLIHRPKKGLSEDGDFEVCRGQQGKEMWPGRGRAWPSWQ
jgi:hypothetical protein